MSQIVEKIRARWMARPLPELLEQAEKYLKFGFFEGRIVDIVSDILMKYDALGFISERQHNALAGYVAFVDAEDGA